MPEKPTGVTQRISSKSTTSKSPGSALPRDRSGQWVGTGQINIPYIVGAVRILDLAVQKVQTLQNNFITWAYACELGNIRVPAVMADFGLLCQRLTRLDANVLDAGANGCHLVIGRSIGLQIALLLHTNPLF